MLEEDGGESGVDISGYDVRHAFRLLASKSPAIIDLLRAPPALGSCSLSMLMAPYLHSLPRWPERWLSLARSRRTKYDETMCGADYLTLLVPALSGRWMLSHAATRSGAPWPPSGAAFLLDDMLTDLAPGTPCSICLLTALAAARRLADSPRALLRRRLEPSIVGNLDLLLRELLHYGGAFSCRSIMVEEELGSLIFRRIRLADAAHVEVAEPRWSDILVGVLEAELGLAFAPAAVLVHAPVTSLSAELPPHILTTITNEIAELERREGVRVVFAAERSSRIWGTAHNASDYDVKVICVRQNRSAYLGLDDPPCNLAKRVVRIATEEEYPEVHTEVEVSGFDIRHAFAMLADGNPSLLEIFLSPMVYHCATSLGPLREFRYKVLAGAPRRKAADGWRAHARRNFDGYIRRRGREHEQPLAKRYVHTARPLLSAWWLDSDALVARAPWPPFLFEELLRTVLDELPHAVPREAHTALAELLAPMRRSALAMRRRIPVLDSWLAAALRATNTGGGVCVCGVCDGCAEVAEQDLFHLSRHEEWGAVVRSLVLAESRRL